VSEFKGGGSLPFPERSLETVRIDSVAEAHAYFTAWPPSNGSWEHIGQLFAPGSAGPEDHLTVRAPDGQTTVVRFAMGSSFLHSGDTLVAPGEPVSAAMRAAHELAKSEGPLHPGTLPQYPVPSASHTGAVAVPLPILALDAGQRGLFAPPRIAVVRWPTAEAVGVGDAPGFNPEQWPPPPLGDWPPLAVRDWPPYRLAGTIERFSAIWVRLLDAWFSGEEYPQLDDEKREARLLLERLVPQGMLKFYNEISPRFWAWLTEDHTP
jgi:hypothetical protein